MSGDDDSILPPEDDGDPPPGVRPGSIRRRLILAASALVLVLAVVALVSRLLTAPIWTGLFAGILQDRLVAALGPDATVHVGVVGFSLDPDFRPRLHLGDVLVSRPDIGSASVDLLSVGRAWYGGGWAENADAGHVLIDLAQGGRALPALSDIVRAFDAAVASPPLRSLDVDALTVRRFGVGGSKVVAIDAAALTAAIDPDRGARATIAGRNASDDWSVRFDGGVPTTGEARDFAVDTAGFTMRDFAALIGQPDPLVDGPLGFSGRLTMTGGDVTAGNGELTFGPLLAEDDTAEPVAGTRGRLELRMDPGEQVVELVPSAVILPAGQAIVSGTVRLPDEGESAAAFDLRLGASGRADGDHAEGIGRLVGSYDPSSGLLMVDKFQAATEGATFNAALRFEHTPDQVSGALSGVVPRLSVDALKALWPPPLVPDARRWVTGRVKAGTITDATVDLAFLDGSGDSPASAHTAQVGGAFRFHDLAFTAYPNGPEIRGAAGSGRLSGNRFDVVLESGYVDLGGDLRMPILTGTYTVPDVHVKPATATIAFTLDGSAEAAVALWSRLPFGRDDRFDLSSAGTTGSVTADVRMTLQLKPRIEPSDLTYEADIDVRDLTLPEPVAGRVLADGNLTITVAGGRAKLTGEALLDGVKAKIDVEQPMTPGAQAVSTVDLLLTAADREKLGIDLGDAVSGPVRVSITGEAGGKGQAVSVDLTSAGVRLTPLGIAKPKGEAGTARFVLEKSPDRTVVRDLVLEAGGARVTGDLVLDGDGRLVKADLPRVVARPGDSVSLTARREASGTLVVTVRGKRFDARRLVRSMLRGGAAAGETGPVRIDATIDTVVGQGEEALTGVNIAAASDNGHLTALALTAQTAGGGAASMTLSPARGSRRLEAEVGEVGRLLRFLGLYGRVEGGRAVVSGTVDPSGGIEATVDGSRLKIVEEPALRRLSTAAQSGPSAGIATVDIERLLFDVAFADGVLSIRDGVVRASTAGLSLQGDIDFGRDVVRLSGTYLPASAFDSLLGKIPLIGQTMFAGGRAGLLGVTFRLSGPIDSPDLTVNPLSAIAPGIFRKLFELR